MDGATKLSEKHTLEENMAWETSWLPWVYDCIKSKHLLCKADVELDLNWVTDVTLKAPGVSIGVRIRRPERYDLYQNKFEVTFRARTEWRKIIDMKRGELMFYGWANPAYTQIRHIRRWTLVSLDALRRIVAKGYRPRTFHNTDGRTALHPVNVLEVSEIDGDFVVDANWGPWNG